MTEQNTKPVYKIGDEVKTKYHQPMTGERFHVGQVVDMFDNDTHKKVASFKVLSEDGVNIVGIVTNTHGHKRRK